jgi:hypothetical protein
MKKLLYILTIIGISSFTQVDWTSCYETYEGILKLYEKYDAENFYMKYKITNESAKGDPQVDVQEVSVFENKSKLKTTWMTHYLDSKVSVLILSRQKMVMLRDAEEGEENTQISNWIMTRDSLEKVTSEVYCNTTDGLTTLTCKMKPEAPDKQHLTKMSIKANANKVISGEYHFHTPQGIEKMTYEYLTYKELTSQPFSGSALSQVLYKGKLKSQFQGYELQDLRKNHYKETK